MQYQAWYSSKKAPYFSGIWIQIQVDIILYQNSTKSLHDFSFINIIYFHLRLLDDDLKLIVSNTSVQNLHLQFP